MQNIFRKTAVAATALAVLGLGAHQAQAQTAFLPGDLVVSQFGNGTETLAATGNTVFLDEYTIAGTQIQQINLTTAAGNSYVNAGNSGSEGALTLSSNGQFLTIGGYKATPVQATSVVGATSANVNREIAVISAAGTVDKTTALTDAYSGGNIRSVASSDGVNFVTGGSTGGERTATLGATTSTVLSTTPSNNRVVNLFGGNTYVSSSSGVNVGINLISGGAATLLAGTGSSTNAYDFVFTSGLSTLYVADSTAGIQKYTLNTAGTAYALAYTFTGATGLTGLTATTSAAGITTLYSVNATNLYTVTDLGATTALTSLATAATGTAFRGVDFAPAAAPEPSSVVSLLVGMGVLGMIVARRRTRQSA